MRWKAILPAGAMALLVLGGSGAVASADPTPSVSDTPSPKIVNPDGQALKGGCGEGPDKPKQDGGSILQREDAAAIVAADLGISLEQAKEALAEIDRIAVNGRLEPAGAAFADVARRLGITPERLDQALRHLKQSMIDKQPALDKQPVPGS
ncbi:MAG: hypothetical protein HOY71_47075 [Nonomuraea sp.]|nr:hypothetical protein [Nonomuraea sp.]